jgi:hypothetical protein
VTPSIAPITAGWLGEERARDQPGGRAVAGSKPVSRLDSWWMLVDAGGGWGRLEARDWLWEQGFGGCGRRAAIGSPRGDFGCDRPQNRPRRRAWAVIGQGSTRRCAVKNRRSALPILSLEAPRGVAVRPAGRIRARAGSCWRRGCTVGYEVVDLAGVRVIRARAAVSFMEGAARGVFTARPRGADCHR